MTKLVAISDLHVGSRVGLAFDKHGDDSYSATRKGIFERWEKAVHGPWRKPDILVINGDLIEGQNPKERGIGVWSTDTREQCTEAAELIKMWKASNIYITRGSKYHTGGNDSGFYPEEEVARMVNAEPLNSAELSAWHAYLTVEDLTFHIFHRVGVSSLFHYKSTPLAREMLYSRLNDMLRHELKKSRTHITLRAHAHYFLALEFSGSLGMVLPCWKGLDEWMLQRGAENLSPDLGYVGFSLDKGKCSWEKNLFRITEIQPAPHVVVK